MASGLSFVRSVVSPTKPGAVGLAGGTMGDDEPCPRRAREAWSTDGQEEKRGEGMGGKASDVTCGAVRCGAVKAGGGDVLEGR